jgi:hypothetical protein
MRRCGGKQVGLIIAVVAAIAIGVVALVSGGKDATTVGPEALADAAQRTSSVKGLRYTMEGETQVPGVGKVPFTGTGVSDIRGKRSIAELDMSEFAKRAPAENGLNDPDNWQMEVAYDSRFLYMKFPLLEPELDGKSWMKMDIIAVSEALGIDPSLMRADQQGGDPTVTLSYLRTVSDDIERVGTEKVRGVESTHYRVTVDLHKYPEVVPAADRDAARRSIDRLIELSGGDEEMAMEVWVGEDKLVRRMKWDQSIKPPGQQQVQRSTFTTEFYDFNAKVNVEPPPDDDTKDVTEQVKAELAKTR